jgi:hypothetical protein
VNLTTLHPPSIDEVAENCPFIHETLKTGGSEHSEPLWKYSLALAARCEDPEAAAHRLSKGHAEYDPTTTEQKLGQNHGAGPPLCATIALLAPQCLTCPHRELGTTPLNVKLLANANAASKISTSDSDTPPGEEGVRLQDFVAFMQSGIYIFRPSGDYWPAHRVDARVPSVPLVSVNGNPIIDKETKKQIVSKASNWLARHAPVEQMTWAPGWSQLIRNKLISNGGWIDRKDVSVFNLYRPPTLVHGDASLAGPWIDHLRKIYPDEADHIIKFLAHRVQRPHEKINHGLVLGGDPGIGKDTILAPVKYAVGPWNFEEV